MVRTAWICDDAYITLRTVDNFVNGYGLRWNVAERVQAYTHPLWMFLLAAVYAITREAFFTTLAVSMIVSIAVVVFLSFRIAGTRLAAAVAVVSLTLSKAFVEYSTSGLENPLTHLLLVLFLWVYFRLPTSGRRILLLSLLAAAGMLCRLDTALLYGPPLACAFAARGRWRDLGYVAIGLLPWLAWECFSLLYYGSPFPNTAYAKLGTGIARIDLLRQGMWYLANSLRWDPLTPLLIVAGMVVPLLTRAWRQVPVVFGIALYLCYVVWIGGDFMSGRYLTAPCLGAVCLLSRVEMRHLGSFMSAWLVVVMAVGFTAERSPLLAGGDSGAKTRQRKDPHGIADERDHYAHSAGLIVGLGKARRGEPIPAHGWAKQGRQTRAMGPLLITRPGIGYFGYFAGPQAHIVDLLALADPLLARLPTMHLKRWRIGHFYRQLPEGYIDSLRSGRNLIADKRLAMYYDDLVLATRGPLLSRDRLLAIWRLNTAAHARRLADYIRDHPPATDARQATPAPPRLSIKMTRRDPG